MTKTYTWTGAVGSALSGSDQANWLPSGGPPGPGDSAIINAGTVLLPDAQLSNNSVYLESATLIFSGDSAINASAPMLDSTTVLTTNVAPAETVPGSAQQTVIDAFGNFVNEGTILADGPAGSTFTINVASTTIAGTFYPGFFVNYNQIEVDAGNAMTINIAGTSEFANTSAIFVNGGTLTINTLSTAIAGGYAPFNGALVIEGGGTIETNAAYGTAVAGIAPSYVFADATAGNTLKIDTIGSFGGQILGFGKNDTIDIGTSIAVGTIVYSSTTGVLALENSGGTILDSLLLSSGNFSTGTFTVSSGVAGSFIIGTGTDGNTQITTNVQNDTWINNSGSWQTSGSWSNGTPGTLDTAIIGFGANSKFTLTTGATPVTVGQLTMASDMALVQITSNTTVAPYAVTQFGGTIEITSGNTLTTSALRQISGSTTLDPTSVLNLTGRLSPGVAANAGTLTISNTNTFAARINGNVLVNGGTINAAPGSKGGGGNIFIGFDGGGNPGSMTVQNSGTNAAVVTDSYTELSSDPVSYGVLTLNGNVSWTDTIDTKDTVTSTGKMIVGINSVASNSGTLTPPSFVNAATLLVENGATLNDPNSAIIGSSNNSSGIAIVESGATWNVGTSGLTVGNPGFGVLQVLTAGTVSVGTGGISVANSIAASAGTITVSGANSFLSSAGGMTVGKIGSGELDILNGGTVLITANGITAGSSATASSAINVSGTDSGSGAAALLNFGTATRGITLGQLGSATLTVSSGGTIQMSGTGGILIGQSANAVGTLEITGSNALVNLGTAASGVTVGQAGTGSLQILNGGTLTIGKGGITIGSTASATGTVTVSGTGSSLTTSGTSGAISVGSPGTGVLSIASGAHVSAAAALSIAGGGTTASHGTVTVDAATLSANGLIIGSSGAGTLTVQNGGQVISVGTVNVNVGGFSGGSSGTLVVNGGTLTDTTSGFFVGNSSASGSLIVQGGGVITTGGTSAFSDINATGTGVASGLVSGGTWTSKGQLTVGDTGAGSLTVNSNGVVNAGTNSVNIGNQNGGNGTISVTAGTLTAGSVNIANSLTGSASGVLTVGVGGIVQATSVNEGGTSTISVNGSLSASSNISIGSNGTGAVLTVGNGGLVTQSGTNAMQIGTGTLTSGAVTVNSGGSLSSSGINVGGPSGGSGTLTINGGSVSDTGQITIGQSGNGSLIVSGGGALSANAGTLVSALSVAGTGAALLSVTGGTVSVSNGSFAIGNAAQGGTLTVGAGGILTTTGGVGPAASIDSSGVAGASATVSGLGATWTVNGQLNVGNFNNGTLSVGAGGLVNAGTNQVLIGNGASAHGTVTLGGTASAQLDAGVLTMAGVSGGTGTLTVNAGGTVALTGGIIGTVSVGGLSVGAGGVLIMAGGTVSASGFSQNSNDISGFGLLGASLNNIGSIGATGGLLDVTGSISGSGTMGIASGATLELDSLVGSGQIVNFATSSGALQVGTIGFSGTIFGIQQGDSLILSGVTDATNANILSGNTLEIVRAGNPFIDLRLDPGQSFTGDFFHIATSSGNTVLTEDTTPCYLAGTRIRTDKGEILVEYLEIGDRVITLDGTAKPIKWIGKRAFSSAFAAGNRDIIPILIRQGAFGRNVPARDLYVSPLHALFFDDVLIQAEHLVNGESILRCPDIDPIRYFHIELDQHDVIFAEGTPAETFVDCDSRGMFHNAPEFARLYPADDAPRWMFCAPRIESGPILEQVRRVIDLRAGLVHVDGDGTPGPLQGNLDGLDGASLTGWAFDPTHADSAVMLEVMDGDGLIARVAANRFRGDLEAAGIGDGRHGFELRLSRALSPLVRHELRVRRVIDGRELPGSPLVIEPHDGRTLLKDARQAIEIATNIAGDPTTLDALLDTLLHSVDHVRRLRSAHRTDGDGDKRPVGWVKGKRQRPKRALIIDDRLPRRDRDAGSNAILSHIAALRTLGWQVEFVASGELSRNDDAAAALKAWGVTCYRAPLIASVEEVLRRNRNMLDLVYLHRLSNAESYTPMVRAWQPKARVVYSLADLHHVRTARQAIAHGNDELLEDARRLKLREINAMRMADAVLTHSHAEAHYLAREAPGAVVRVVPWALHPSERRVKLRSRNGVAFIGGMRHAPNPDAVRFLADAIMPRVWERDPDMPCLIVGSDWSERVWGRLDRRIELVGQVDRLDEIFDQVRLTVAPLRFGAGIKGKVLDSFAAGVPCVMSSIAAEGIPLGDVLRTAVTDDVGEMADLICDLHHQTALHGRHARAGLALVREHYTDALIVEAMERVVGSGVAKAATESTSPVRARRSSALHAPT